MAPAVAVVLCAMLALPRAAADAATSLCPASLPANLLPYNAAPSNERCVERGQGAHCRATCLSGWHPVGESTFVCQGGEWRPLGIFECSEHAWQSLGNDSYILDSATLNHSKTWAAALRYCRALGASLLRLAASDSATVADISSLLHAGAGARPRWVWPAEAHIREATDPSQPQPLPQPAHHASVRRGATPISSRREELLNVVGVQLSSLSTRPRCTSPSNATLDAGESAPKQPTVHCSLFETGSKSAVRMLPPQACSTSNYFICSRRFPAEPFHREQQLHKQAVAENGKGAISVDAMGSTPAQTSIEEKENLNRHLPEPDARKETAVETRNFHRRSENLKEYMVKDEPGATDSSDVQSSGSGSGSGSAESKEASTTSSANDESTVSSTGSSTSSSSASGSGNNIGSEESGESSTTATIAGTDTTSRTSTATTTSATLRTTVSASTSSGSGSGSGSGESGESSTTATIAGTDTISRTSTSTSSLAHSSPSSVSTPRDTFLSSTTFQDSISSTVSYGFNSSVGTDATAVFSSSPSSTVLSPDDDSGFSTSAEFDLSTFSDSTDPTFTETPVVSFSSSTLSTPPVRLSTLDSITSSPDSTITESTDLSQSSSSGAILSTSAVSSSSPSPVTVPMSVGSTAGDTPSPSHSTVSQSSSSHLSSTPSLPPVTREPFLRLRCGSVSDFISATGATWSGDKHFLPATSSRRNPAVPIISGFEEPSLFVVERFSSLRTVDVPFYSIPVPPGLYEVHLLFVETRASGPGERVFSASANNATEMSIDIAARVGLASLLRVVLLDAFVDENGTLNISLLPLRGNSKINALELFRQSGPARPEPQPALYSLRLACGQFVSVIDEANGVVWDSDRFFVESNTQARAHRSPRAMPISDVDSRGNPVDPFLFSRERFAVSTAPSAVFYRVPVPVGKYAITLYFVESIPIAPGERVFDVVVSNQTLAQSVDTATRAPAGIVFTLHFPEVFLLSGVFELALMRVVGNPKINALSVQQLAAPSLPATLPNPAPTSLRINCGSPHALVDGAGREWIADRFFSESTQDAAHVLRPVANISRDLWPLFEFSRVSLPDGLVDPTFYSLDMPEGLYDLTLYFCERSPVSVGERVFDVLVNEDLLMTDVDVARLAGAHTAVWLTLRSIVVRRGEALRVGFQRRRGQAILSALALDPVSAAPPQPAPPPPANGVIRIDCGSFVAHTDALGNVWAEDTLYSEEGLPLQQDITRLALSGDPLGAPLLYSTVRAAVHEELDCCTPRTLYRLPAQHGQYTLTLFFADALSGAPRERVFDVLVNGRVAVSEVDIFATVGPGAVLALPIVGVEPEGGFVSLAFRAVVGVPIISALELAPLRP